MKKFFKRLAKYVVVAYAKRMYRKAVSMAEKRHDKEKTTIYVISSFTDPSQLVTCNRSEFRKMKQRLGIQKHYIQHLKSGSWYHTSDAIGNNSLPLKDQVARRIAFIRMVVKRAKLN